MDESLTEQTPAEDVQMEEAAEGNEDDSQAAPDADADEDQSHATSAPDENDEEEEEENKSVATSIPGEDAEEEENKSVATSVPGEDAGEEDNKSVATSVPGEDAGEEDNKSIATSALGEMDAEEEENKSVATSVPGEMDAEEEENKSVATSIPAEDASTVSTPVPAVVPKKKRGKPQIPASARKGRAPAVKGLHIPFRTVKKAMKLDPDIPIVQNEAAIMTTLAAELFLKRLAEQSQKICKKRGKNTIRYEDVADARSNDPSLAFLKTIIP